MTNPKRRRTPTVSDPSVDFCKHGGQRPLVMRPEFAARVEHFRASYARTGQIDWAGAPPLVPALTT